VVTAVGEIVPDERSDCDGGDREQSQHQRLARLPGEEAADDKHHRYDWYSWCRPAASIHGSILSVVANEPSGTSERLTQLSQQAPGEYGDPNDASVGEA
jgi:hypothetical protein